MARSDLLIALVKAASAGDKSGVRAAVEAIIAEERAKQHTVLADWLAKAMHTNGHGAHASGSQTPEHSERRHDFVAEIMPRRRLEDLVLSEDCRQIISEVIEEQQRASLLRSHNLAPRHRILLVGPPGNGRLR